jgi:hypothetical protein
MNPPFDDSDQFFWEQFGQLRAKGYSPDEAADILLRAQKAVLEACRKVLERCENGEPLTEQERPSCGGDNDAEHPGTASATWRRWPGCGTIRAGSSAPHCPAMRCGRASRGDEKEC